MKLDLKELIAKMVKPSSCTLVTLPFTPSCNGLLLCLIRVSASTRAYIIFSNATPNIADTYQVAGGYSIQPVFVTKGNKVSETGSYNIQEKAYYFIPLVGGVVRSLLKALKPLTLGRGWAV